MLFDFFYIVSELKKTSRRGWKEKIGIDHPESVADHSYSAAIMAMVFSDLKKLDTEKMLKMALLHDLAESITGDFTPDEISKNNKKKIENQTMKEILSKLPLEISNEYEKIWYEFQDGISKESTLMHEIDRLEIAIQSLKYNAEGYPKEKLALFFESAKKDIKTREILEILDEISYK
ncbi:HD domain protein [uncultured archaeon]|nr:HD domain protein [uncultured archaeon]